MNEFIGCGDAMQLLSSQEPSYDSDGP
jgi:hypothetical protein